ncbi:MAG: DnaA regulatory inactivator Hda [Pseudomonadales bacterium]|nr:DnaA regulatory inactivator Hda [Pseudomonadales bacterium]
MSDQLRQLTIPLRLNALCDFENFHAGRNAELVNRLENLTAAGVFSGLFLWGQKGRGCSHLLQATCHRFTAAGRRSAYLPLADLPRDPDLLSGLEDADLVAVDDLQTWLGSVARESALMALYQGLLASGRRLLVASAAAPTKLDFALADLASRMRGLEVFEVQPLDDDGLRDVLTLVARRKGLTLDEAVLDFWLHRSSRHLPDLLEQLEALDLAALAAQRRLTIPLLKAVLEL